GSQRWVGRDIGDVDQLLCLKQTEKMVARSGLDHRLALPLVPECDWRAMERDDAKHITFVKGQRPTIGFAKVCRILQHGPKYRLQLARRRANDAQHIRCCRLLL